MKFYFKTIFFLTLVASIIFVSLTFFMVTPIGACSCSRSKTSTMLLIYLASGRSPTKFSGNCQISSKNYCIEFINYSEQDAQNSFCKLQGGIFTITEKCNRQNLIGKCNLQKLETGKVYYSSFGLENAKTDCRDLTGSFSETQN